MWKARVLAALVTALAAVVATSGSAAAGTRGSVVLVHGTDQGLTVIHPPVRAGLVRFVVDTANAKGSDVSMFAPTPGKSPDDVLADLREEANHDDPQIAAKGTRDLVADAHFFGITSVVKGTPVVVSEQLKRGTYYLLDVNPLFADPPQTPKLTTLQVTGPGGHQNTAAPDGPGRATVKLTSQDRFISPNVLPKTGTITVNNVSDTIHFMDLSPVKPGTTDQEIQDFFGSPDQQGPPPFAADGPSIEMGVLSPGRHADISYRLPAGTYVMACFIADDTTGMPHAIMGMHKVVTLQ